MVVLAIIMTITLVVITNQSSFNKTLVLANTAYDVALSIRNAETYGIGSNVVANGVANAGYGMHFQNGTTYTRFIDVNSPNSSNCHGLPTINGLPDSSAPDAQWGDCVYQVTGDVKDLDYTLGNNVKISDICAFTNDWHCTYTHGPADNSLTSLDIVFSRPNSTAFMSMNGVYSKISPVTKACITLSEPQNNNVRYVSVSASGNIVANAPSCP
jgi:hypothetical protein